MRTARHVELSAALAACSDDELAALIGGTPGPVGVGGATAVVDVGGAAVFTKRIPLTARELARPHGTANLHDVPLTAQYGLHLLAGPGFNGWRELAANQVVTRGVLAGKTENFALMHHWRVLPGRPPVADEHRDVGAVVDQFHSDPCVRLRLEELADAPASLVLFAEHVPAELLGSFTDPARQAENLERQLLDLTRFLRSRELLHLDGHLGNLRADGDRVVLVDFGLATSPGFDLNPEEREFVARHVGHDTDYAMMWLVNWVVESACGIPALTGGSFDERDRFHRRCADGAVPPALPAPVVGVLTRHARTAVRMNEFCLRLYGGDIHATYPKWD